MSRSFVTSLVDLTAAQTVRPFAVSARILMCSIAILGAIVGQHSGSAEDQGEADLGRHYGFLPLEVFKLEQRSHSVVSGDFNHDGLNDLAAVDNSHSRIDLLLQRTQPKIPDSAAANRDVNRIDSHWRFEHVKLSVDRSVSALTSHDLDGDGKVDLAYFGEPDRLIVRYQTENGEFDRRTETRIADVSASPWSIAAGDLNGDKRADLAVLGQQVTYILYQKADGTFQSPQQIRNTATELGIAMIGDLNGDGRLDLFYVATGDDERVACVRLQSPQGELGPERRLNLKNFRGFQVHDLNGDGVHEIVAIDSQTNRVRVLRLEPAADANEPVNSLVQYGIGPQGTGKRDLATGDLNGDGLTDVVISDPLTAQVLVYQQRPGSGLDLGNPYPSFLGVEQLACYDFDADRKSELVLLSPTEKTLGMCRFADGRLEFPKALPVVGEVATFAITDLNGDSVPEILYITVERTGRSSAKVLLRGLSYTKNGETQPYVFGVDKTEIEVEMNDPHRITVLDANGDKRPDLLITTELGRTPVLLLTDEQGVPGASGKVGGVQLGEVTANSISLGDLDGPAVMVSQGNFARRIQLDTAGHWQVLDQYNANDTGSKVKGAAILDIDGQPGNEIALVDVGTKQLRFLRKEGELFRPWRVLDIGGFPFQSLRVADMNNDNRPDLLLFGGGRFAILYTGKTDPQLKELGSFETQLDKTLFVDVAAGDLNGDGRPEIVALDNESHYVQIIAVQPNHQMLPAMHFRVFEEKGFRGAGGGGMEPREALITDVTGDNRSDLILLVHDRLLIYPQDPGPKAE